MEAGDIYSDNDKNVYESTAPTSRRWFSGFVMEEKCRMVVVGMQDEALTVYQPLFIGEISEGDR